jgi:hypothetical protein
MGGKQATVDEVSNEPQSEEPGRDVATGMGITRAPFSLNLESSSLSMLCLRMIRLMTNEAIAAPVIVQ